MAKLAALVMMHRYGLGTKCRYYNFSAIRGSDLEMGAGVVISKRKKRQQGFTLMEIMIVCVIMAIVALGVSASLSGFYTRSRLRSASARLASLANYARTRALTSGHRVILHVDCGSGEASLSEQQSSDTDTTTPIATDQALQLNPPLVISGLEIEGESKNAGDIVFYPTVGAQAATITLVINESGSEVRTITINKVTGRAIAQ
jgi:type II secretion system protein H